MINNLSMFSFLFCFFFVQRKYLGFGESVERREKVINWQVLSVGLSQRMRNASDFKSKPQGCLIDDGEIVTGACRATWWRALNVLENGRGPVRLQVFPYTCVEMSGGLTDIASCTACAREFINHTWSQSIGDRVFHTTNLVPRVSHLTALGERGETLAHAGHVPLWQLKTSGRGLL